MNPQTGKRGNAIWVQCTGCGEWFHVSASMLAAKEAKLHCPHCHKEFRAEEQARIARPQ